MMLKGKLKFLWYHSELFVENTCFVKFFKVNDWQNANFSSIIDTIHDPTPSFINHNDDCTSNVVSFDSKSLSFGSNSFDFLSTFTLPKESSFSNKKMLIPINVLINQPRLQMKHC